MRAKDITPAIDKILINKNFKFKFLGNVFTIKVINTNWEEHPNEKNVHWWCDITFNCIDDNGNIISEDDLFNLYDLNTKYSLALMAFQNEVEILIKEKINQYVPLFKKGEYLIRFSSNLTY